MPQFVMAKLPPHWVFVPPKRQVRELLARLGATVRLVEFFGTGFRGSANHLSLGFVESRVVKHAWCFYLRLWGARDADVGERKEDLSQAALASIEHYIQGRLNRPPAEVIKPEQMWLSFWIRGQVAPRCRTRIVDRYSYPTPSWWQSE
jgi:hypothetical protein